MRKRLFGLLAMLAVAATAGAQSLQLVKSYGKNWAGENVTMKNKPNGIIYRLRVENQNEPLPRVPEAQRLELFIADPTDQGWMALYRKPMGAPDYDFVVVLYDHNKQPVRTVNLCDITGNRYCEVQDVRWDADTHHLLFNMACPSYARQINGKGSKLYCYDVEQQRMVWETGYLVSNDIFILDRDFVYCSYGFTSEKDYLFMLDKRTGRQYSKIPMTSKVHYLEKQTKNGRELLYVVDYNDNLYTYAIQGASAKPLPEVFTVVYATSEDGFLNIRAQPSTNGAILGKLWMQSHGLGSGVLKEKGERWSKVSVGDVTGWVFNGYLGTQTWYDGTGRSRIVAKREQTPVYGENYADDGDYPLFTTVKKGTLIADQYDEIEGYYVLKTGHDYLFIRKSDVEVVNN